MIVGIFILLFISIFIIQSFLTAIVFTFLLVYILNPIYSKAKKIFRYQGLTSIIIILTFILLFLVPLAYTTVQLSKDLNNIDKNLVTSKLAFISKNIENKIGVNPNLGKRFDETIDKITLLFEQTVIKIPEFVFNLFIIIFFYFYFSRDYRHEILFIKNIFQSTKMINIETKFENLVKGIVYGQILVRFIQAVLASIGFLLIGVNGAIIWGIMTFFVSFLPLVGTGLVWIPLALFSYAKGETISALLILSVGIVVSTIDNILLPFIISGKTKIGPVMTLVSILGGIKLFGIYGILLGPVIVGTLFLLFEELVIEIRRQNPRLRKYIWTEKERKSYRNLPTKKAREEFIRILNERYTKNEKDENITVNYLSKF